MNPEAFAREWVAAWNSHDLERILSHYAEDVVFESPYAEKVTGSARVVGKDALRAYWARGLSINTDLHFTLKGVYGGSHGVAIRYHSSRTGHEAVEVLQFNEAGLASWAAAYYE